MRVVEAEAPLAAPCPCPELGFSWQYRKGSGLDIEAHGGWADGGWLLCGDLFPHHLQLGRQAIPLTLTLSSGLP